MRKLMILAAGVTVLALFAVPSGARAEITTVIVIEDMPFPCKIVKHDEKVLTVFLLELKTLVTIEWDKLDPAERKRLRALVTVSEAEATGRRVGKQIDGVEVRLASGMSYRGIEFVDRQTTSHRAFRFPGVHLMVIPVGDIKDVKPCKVYEGEIYSAQERYRVQVATSPPQTALDYFRLGEWCLENRLALEANENFAKCILLDPGYDERCKDKKEALDRLTKELQAREIFNRITINKAHGRYSQVLKDIDLLVSQYPDFPENTKLAMEVPIIKEKHAKYVRREVVSLWYMHMLHLVNECATARVSETPPVPAKRVTLTSGFQIQGTLKSAEDAEEIVLEAFGRTYKVNRKEIARIEAIMVENGPFRDRTLAECRKYVQDPKSGISADILAAVTKDLGITDKEAREVWDKRLADPIIVKGKGLEEPELAVAFHDAHWGVGSWLRGGGGSAGAGGSAAGGTGGARGGRTRNPRGSGGVSPVGLPVAPGGSNPGVGGVNPRVGGGRAGGGRAGGGQQPQWKDEETWWKEQPGNVKADILHAMCAEAIMHVEKVFEEPCINCGGTGQIEVMNVAGGGRYSYPCSVCRGGGKFYGVTYR